MNPKHGPITTQVTYSCAHRGMAEVACKADLPDLQKLAASMPCPQCRDTRRMFTSSLGGRRVRL